MALIFKFIHINAFFFAFTNIKSGPVIFVPEFFFIKHYKVTVIHNLIKVICVNSFSFLTMMMVMVMIMLMMIMKMMKMMMMHYNAPYIYTKRDTLPSVHDTYICQYNHYQYYTV